MASVEGVRGYLHPFYFDGAAIAASAHFAPDVLTLVGPTPYDLPEGSDADPEGTISVTRSATGQSFTIDFDASSNTMNEELSVLFAELPYAPNVRSRTDEKRGSTQVRPPHGNAPACWRTWLLA